MGRAILRYLAVEWSGQDELASVGSQREKLASLMSPTQPTYCSWTGLLMCVDAMCMGLSSCSEDADTWGRQEGGTGRLSSATQSQHSSSEWLVCYSQSEPGPPHACCEQNWLPVGSIHAAAPPGFGKAATCTAICLIKPAVLSVGRMWGRVSANENTRKPRGSRQTTASGAHT